ncbi:MAG TPA: transketolase [Planctomycetes bacterium]|nr:transketolase [Planctomycetota bacterium]
MTEFKKTHGLSDIDELCVQTIRFLSLDAIQKAKSGHPGMPMGMAAAAYTLWTRHLRHSPANPAWANRDRFVLSAGHGSMLLYSLLYLTGYDVSLDEIKNFRQWESKTPGHPEYGLTPGVEVTTGPLGQGVANAVGMAIAQKYLAARYNRDDFALFDYNIYVIAGDGCLQEGVSSEASSLAGHLGLDNLIVVYDDNHITIDGQTELSFTEDRAKRYEAYGWYVQVVGGDGDDMEAFDKAIAGAKAEKDRPSFIQFRTHIAYGSPNFQDKSSAHGSPLGDDEIKLIKKEFGWDPEHKFSVPKEILEHTRKAVDKGSELEKEWLKLISEYSKLYPELAVEIQDAQAGKTSVEVKDVLSKFEAGGSIATRKASGIVLDAIMPNLPLVLGGSADLTPSNNTKFKGAEVFSRKNRTGRYIHYGVREHGMAAVMNGMSAGGLLRPYGGTFLCFADYMRPAIRLAAMSGHPAIFVFTHDSIGLGEDGPTHQPIEQIASLRAIPNLVVIRPADANETAYAWKYALEYCDRPVALILTRQGLPNLDQKEFASASNLEKGAYSIIGQSNPDVILMATGSEVHPAIEAHNLLADDGIKAQVLSMPSWEIFEAQDSQYQESVLPARAKARIGIEAGVRQGWDKWLGDGGIFIGMSSFGASAPGKLCFEKFGITAGAIAEAAKSKI